MRRKSTGLAGEAKCMIASTRAGHVDVVRHVVLDERETAFTGEVRDVVGGPGDEVVHGDDLVTVGEEPIAEVRADESGAPRSQALSFQLSSRPNSSQKIPVAATNQPIRSGRKRELSISPCATVAPSPPSRPSASGQRHGCRVAFRCRSRAEEAPASRKCSDECRNPGRHPDEPQPRIGRAGCCADGSG